jgi:Spy/CpxP family protein refolding chaperone
MVLSPSTIALVLALTFSGPPQGRGFGPPPGGNSGSLQNGPSEEDKERFRIKIGATKEQQNQIDLVFKDSDVQMSEIRGKFRELSQQLYSLYDIYDFDRNLAKGIRRDLLKLHKRMADIHAENEEKLRRILTKDQFERMKALMKEEYAKRMKDMQSRRGGKGGPPPPGHP